MSNDSQKATPKPDRSLILASGSPRRKSLLAEIIENFEVIVPHVDEMISHAGGPAELVAENAWIKANSVVIKYPERWVLGSDTVVVLNEEVLGKPKDIIEAKNMLQKLSGKKHQVHTAICLINRSLDLQKKETFTSYVTFRELNEQIIESYFSIVDPLDKAGAYAMQTKPEMLIKSFEGSRNNIIGLPIEKLAKWFMKFRIN